MLINFVESISRQNQHKMFEIVNILVNNVALPFWFFATCKDAYASLKDPRVYARTICQEANDRWVSILGIVEQCNKHADIMKYVIDVCTNQERLLAEAASCGNLCVVKALLKKQPLTFQALMVAAESGNDRVLRHMLWTCDLHCFSAYNVSRVARMAAMRCREIKTIDKFIDVGFEDELGIEISEVFYGAVYANRTEFVEFIISKHGIYDHERCILTASKMGNIEVLRLLLSFDHHEDVVSVALDLAVSFGHNDIVVMLLDEHGARADECTTFEDAVIRNYTDVVRTLLAHGADDGAYFQDAYMACERRPECMSIFEDGM